MLSDSVDSKKLNKLIYQFSKNLFSALIKTEEATLSTDYSPEGLLAECCPPGIPRTRFPLKTIMRVGEGGASYHVVRGESGKLKVLDCPESFRDLIPN